MPSRTSLFSGCMKKLSTRQPYSGQSTAPFEFPDAIFSAVESTYLLAFRAARIRCHRSEQPGMRVHDRNKKRLKKSQEVSSDQNGLAPAHDFPNFART